MLKLRKRLHHAKWLGAQAFGYLFGVPALAPIHRAIALAAIHALGYGNNRNHIFSGEEWFVRSVLQPAGVRSCIDVGANVGQYGSLLVRYLPGPIYSFEPLSGAYEELKQIDGIHAHRFIVGDLDGEAKIYSRKEAWEGATVHGEMIEGAPIVETVPAITLDSFIRRHGLKDINFVKIDTEGHELEVLKGMQGLIADNPPQFIQFEFGPAHAQRGHTLHHFREMLPAYQLYRLLPHGLVPVDPGKPLDSVYMFSNVIAQRRSR